MNITAFLQRFVSFISAWLEEYTEHYAMQLDEEGLPTQRNRYYS